MLVMILETVPVGLRGELTRWLIEPHPGVFVGHVSGLVRDRLWLKCCQGVHRRYPTGSADFEGHVTASNTTAPGRRIDELRNAYGGGAAERKVALLRELERRRLPGARAVESLHEFLCCLRAYPDNAEVLARVERMLAGFERRAGAVSTRGIVRSRRSPRRRGGGTGRRTGLKIP